MQLSDLKISTQLKIGLGIILAFIMLLGIIAITHTNLMWQEMFGLYQHPIKVSKAVVEVKADVLAIRSGMKELFLSENDQDTQTVMKKMAGYEADAQQQFGIMFERYLGPRKDIEELHTTFMQWKTIREETIRLFRSGETAKAVQRTKSSGIGGAHAEQLLSKVQKVSDFAMNKANEFFEDATRLHDSLHRQIILIICLLTALTAGIGYYLFTSIRNPMNKLTTAAQQFQKGNLDARSSYVSTNEFGILSSAFNQMAEGISLRIETEKRNAALAKTLIIANELKEFAGTVLEKFIEITESNLGAFYIRNSDNNNFVPITAIGANHELLKPFDAAIFEGEFGKALKTKQLSHIKNVQEETAFKFRTFAGTFVPREIITIPVVVNEKVLAMLSLASFSAYSETSMIALGQPSLITLNTAFANLIANDETRQLAEKLRENNQELQAQQEELQAQTEELRKQSEELQKQNIELEQQRLAVEEANRLKSAFLSNMSHELRTPLNSVMALSRVLMMQTGEKLNIEEVNYLEIIERNGKNLLTLINEILDLAKIEAGRMDVSPKPFTPGQTIEDIIDSLAPLASEKNIEIRRRIPKDLPLIESDESRVYQILQNLLANAIKFTASGSVTVSAKCSNENISVMIKDTGIGIKKEDLPYIFDEFRQVDGSSSRKHEGTGLGLAIASKTARMLGGEITVSSIYGQGSTFTLTLPITWQGIEPVQQAVVNRAQTGIKSARKTILVVDDEPEMAAMISRYLLQEGYNTITATSGEEALKLAAREHPYAVTLDVIMPEMDGWEVLQGLKKNPETRDIPVIIVSMSEDQATGFALGAVGYVSKPVSRGLLISEIEKIGNPRTCSIMVVDDNDIDRQELKHIIEKEGMTPILIESGAGCLKLIEEHIPDLLILDLIMPEMDGFAVLEKIRSTPATRDLPIIVATAKDLTEEDKKKLSGNVFSILQKRATPPAILLQEIKRSLKNLEIQQKQQKYEESSAKYRILLVEDNAAAIIQVKSFLESAGYIADVARNAQEALAYVSHTIPDGIVLDLMMPEIDGFEVLERIRSTRATAKIPVLILTAKDLTPEDFKRLSSNNVQQMVQKGDIDRASLLEKVASLLRARPGQPVSIIEANLPAILIMEDNPDNMATFKAILKKNYRIIEAADGEIGLQKASEIVPDLILLDMSLPKIDGFAVVGHLKSDIRLQHIPVIAVTARVMKGDQEKIMKAGCDDYIAKPVDPKSFTLKIAEWLRGKSE